MELAIKMEMSADTARTILYLLARNNDDTDFRTLYRQMYGASQEEAERVLYFMKLVGSYIKSELRMREDWTIRCDGNY